MQRRHLLQAGPGALLAAPAWLRAQALEKPKVTIAVGGKNLLYYLPLTIAEQRGYFKAEGLDVTIVDFAGGARALQAVVGGSADVVSGAFEHTVNMQAKGQRLRAFVLQGRAPQIVLGVNPKRNHSEMISSTRIRGAPVIKSSEIPPNSHAAPAKTTAPIVRCNPNKPSVDSRARTKKNCRGKRRCKKSLMLAIVTFQDSFIDTHFSVACCNRALRTLAGEQHWP